MRSPDLAAPAAGNGLAVLIGALAVAGAGALALALVDLGPLSLHMAVHIGLMNVAAPLAAVALLRSAHASLPKAPLGLLWSATLAQLGLLWVSHSPAVHHAAQASPFGLATLHAGLFLSALLFWLCVEGAATSRWQAMLALLVSGKFACLLGALLIFAPRVLYGTPASVALHHTHGASVDPAAALADQHLAGLLMIAACPLSYVSAAVVLAAQAVTGLDSRRAPVLSAPRIAGP